MFQTPGLVTAILFNRLETRDKDWAKLKLWGASLAENIAGGIILAGRIHSWWPTRFLKPILPRGWAGSSILFKSSYHGWSSMFELYLVVIVPPCLSEKAIFSVCHPIGIRFWDTT